MNMLIFKVMFIPQILYPLVPWGFDPCPYGKVEAPYQRKNYSVPHSALKHPPSINACIKGHLKNNQLFPSLHPLNLTIHPRSNLNHSAGLYRSLWWQLTCPPLWYLKIYLKEKEFCPPQLRSVNRVWLALSACSQTIFLNLVHLPK